MSNFSPITVSIVVVNWNGKHYLSDCLQSIFNQTYSDYEVIVVDNGSTDSSQDFIKAIYPQVKLIENNINLGFAEGNNIGIREAKGEYIITLNNDTKVSPGFIEEMVKVADSDEKVGMVAAKMVSFFNPKTIDSTGIRLLKNGLGFDIGHGVEDHGQYDEIRDVFGPCAGAALYKKKMLHEIGLFDESFFAYYEDLDLAWRGRLDGWKCLTAPKAMVFHIHSGTTGKYSKFKVYHLHRNKIWVLIKNWPLPILFKYLHLIIFYDILSILYSLIHLKSFVSIKGKVDAFKGIREILRKRYEIKKTTKISLKEIEALFSPIENPIATLKRKMKP